MKICAFCRLERLKEVFYEERPSNLEKRWHRGDNIDIWRRSHGIMGACAKGVKAGGGRVIGISPGFSICRAYFSRMPTK